MTIDEALQAVSTVWRGQDIWLALYEAKQTAEQLTRVQGECTALLNENRLLRAQLAKLTDTGTQPDTAPPDHGAQNPAPQPSSNYELEIAPDD